MAIAKSLKTATEFFTQICPLCGSGHRMMIRGLYIDPETKKGKLYPDMGYSFCNCRNIFFTKYENITSNDGGFNSCKDPLDKLRVLFDECKSGQVIKITMRDPYFILWSNPHDYTGFNPRVNYILWDMHSFSKECGNVGFEIVSMDRDMDVESKTPECYHIIMRKP